MSKILLLEQEKEIREFVVSCLTNGMDHVRVKSCTEPAQLLSTAQEWQPDVIIIEGSPELCVKLKDNNQTSGIKVIFLAMSLDIEHRLQAYQAGAVEYIVKPFSPSYLSSKIELLLDTEGKHTSLLDSLHGYRPTVMVVDDAKSVREIYCSVLEEMSCNSIACEDGQEAWALLKTSQENIDLILTDIEMPKVDGKELVKLIRLDAQFDTTPIIVASHLDSQNHIDELLNMGANDYITKPFVVDNVKSRLMVNLRVGQIMHDQVRLNRELDKFNEVLEFRIKERTIELYDANMDSIYRLALVCESRDKTTGDHIKRVRYYSELVATELGLAGNNIEEIGYSSMLHDIGKVSIADEILNKPGRFTEEEYAIMRTHSNEGAKLLGDNDFFEVARDIARYHHERLDGSGYPDGLQGDDIPLSAQIVAVVDVYDALSSKRQYKEAWPQEEVIAELQDKSGVYFSPKVVSAFMRAYNEGKIEQIREKYS